MQKQRVEDDQKRSEKLEKLYQIRMAEQIVFDEEVVRAPRAPDRGRIESDVSMEKMVLTLELYR
jgi:hypothetical protein